MNTEKKENYTGIATLYEKTELKKFFSNYLYFIVGIEILIFLLSFIGNICLNKEPIPWKFYFYVSFIIPLAVTFLLGIFILAFNHFLFGNINLVAESNIKKNNKYNEQAKLFKINLFLAHLRQIPFLPTLFVMMSGAILLYKLDVILLFIFSAGEKVITYILIGSGIFLFITVFFSIILLFINYKMSKKQMEHEYKYRNDIVDKLGFLIINDHTIMNKEGEILSKNILLQPSTAKNQHEILDQINIIPSSKEKNK